MTSVKFITGINKIKLITFKVITLITLPEKI